MVLLLVSGLIALVLLGAVGRIGSAEGSGGRFLDAKPVLGETAAFQPSVVVDRDSSVAERVAKYRDVVFAVASGLFVLAIVGGRGLIVWAAAVWPGRAWWSVRRGRAPPVLQLLDI
jgi:hypothetical protein